MPTHRKAAASLGRPSVPVILLALGSLLLGGSGSAGAADGTGLGHARVEAGDVAVIPIVVLDAAATALGTDAGTGRRIQGLSVSLDLGLPARVSEVSFRKAGLTDGPTPIYETQASDSGGVRHSWILAFDEGSAPLAFQLGAGDLVGFVDITVDPGAQPGELIGLGLESRLTALSNQGGSVVATSENGGLVLADGSVLVTDTPLFADGFETGNTAGWSASQP